MEDFDVVIECLDGLNRFYNAIMTPKLFLTPAETREAQDAMEQCLLQDTVLTHRSLESDRQMFNVTEKILHYPWHIAWMCTYFNPRMAWTYADEDFMGKLARLLKRTIHGLGPIRVGAAFLIRYRTRVHMRYNRRRDPL